MVNSIRDEDIIHETTLPSPMGTRDVGDSTDVKLEQNEYDRKSSDRFSSTPNKSDYRDG